MKAFFVFMSTALLTLILSTPIAFFASIGRGYLLPIGFIILIIILTQLIMVVLPGLAPYIPWAIPALFCGAAGPSGPQIGAVSYLILILRL